MNCSGGPPSRWLACGARPGPRPLDRFARLARAGVLDLPEYVPGKPVEEVRRELGLEDVLKLASNENPLGPSPLALRALASALAAAHVYPEAAAPELRAAIARRHGVTPDMVLVGNGADNVITMICLALLEPGQEIVTGAPTFPAYEHAARVAGGRPVFVPLRDHAFDLEALAAAVGPWTKLVFVCTPNNPTGTVSPREELLRFVDGLPERVVVVVDAAYAEYAEDPRYEDGLELIRQGRNVLMLRTFSKVFGLAGLRVGYGVAPPGLIRVLERVREPFPVNRLAQAAALAALDDREHLERSLAVNREGKSYLYKELAARGLRYVPTEANFLLVDVGRPADDLYRRLLRRGVVVRPGTAWGLPTSIRVTIGTRDQLARFLQALDAALEEG